MTEKQMDKVRDTYRHTPYYERTEEQRRLGKEISCRDMINSCLCYGGIGSFWQKIRRWDCETQSYQTMSYADDYIKELGEDRVRELVAEQEADFAKATVHRGVFTDDEGLSYNSIEWADDKEE